jgi:hypothetical protein
MSVDKIEIADLDCIYLSYDEPQKEEFWVKIKNMIPWARRVDGVKGSDAAHKAAAEESDTDRFIVIDGDNIPDMEFFNLELDYSDKDPIYKEAQYRWKARNIINGLTYGNGGISCWTKEYVMNMKTHEVSEGDVKTTVDFCLDYNNSLYWSMYDCYSTTYPNCSPFQAFRAGFREGVKMCLVGGQKPSVDEFKRMVSTRNLNHLTIWHNVGKDVENGIWAIYGSRLGTKMTMLSDWDHTQVQSFDYLQELWETISWKNEALAEHDSWHDGDELYHKLGLPICTLDTKQSEFFKRHYNIDKHNLGPLVKEIDVIRKIEGW